MCLLTGSGTLTQRKVSQGVRRVFEPETFCVLHCNENPIYVFPEKELRRLSPNFHIHVSVSDLYIPRIDLHIFLQQNWQTDCGNIHINRSETHECGNLDWGLTIPFLGKHYLFLIFGILSLQCERARMLYIFLRHTQQLYTHNKCCWTVLRY